jgi:hypothetical protein
MEMTAPQRAVSLALVLRLSAGSGKQATKGLGSWRGIAARGEIVHRKDAAKWW